MPTQHLGLQSYFQLLAAGRHHLLGHLVPLIVNKRLIVNVRVQYFLIETQEINYGMSFGHEHEVLSLDVQDTVTVNENIC